MSADDRPGHDLPDGRGRIGLNRTGRGLSGNPDVRITDVEVVSDGWHVLRRTTFDYRGRDGEWTTQARETYDRGNGATVLLYDPHGRTLLLSRQFRLPAYVNGHTDGMLVEAAAGLLDGDEPDEAIRREAEEELGVRVDALEHLFDLFMSPGSVTECVHFYAAEYHPAAIAGGGGLAEEGEEIEPVTVGYDDALAMVADGRIVDGKTVILLQWAALNLFGR